MSIVATETSTVTFLSVPGKSYVANGNFTFLQIAFGYIIGRFAIIVFLLPAYFRGEMLSAYHVLESRFGLTTRRLASLVFLVTRNLADGLRLYLSAVALDIALGGGLITSIVVMTVITAIYSCAGGVQVGRVERLRSVCRVHGRRDCDGVDHRSQSARRMDTTGGVRPCDTHRWQFFDFDPSLTKPSVTFWSGLFGGAFLSLATHGVDQMIVQRYLCARDQKSASWALGLSGFVVFAQFALFLLIGVGAGVLLFDSSGSGRDSEGRRQSVHDVCRRPHGHWFPRA